MYLSCEAMYSIPSATIPKKKKNNELLLCSSCSYCRHKARALPFCSLKVTGWDLQMLNFNKKQLVTLPCFIYCVLLQNFHHSQGHDDAFLSPSRLCVTFMVWHWVPRSLCMCKSTIWVPHVTLISPVSGMQILPHSMAEPMSSLQPAVQLLPEHSAVWVPNSNSSVCLLCFLTFQYKIVN